MSHPASRLLGMLELLQAHPQLTTGRLAADLHVDERTVRRYAVTLAELGVPVEAVRGRYGGYRLSPGYKLPPLMLTDDEAVAVALGLVAADHIGLGTEAPATASALAKLRRVLPAPLTARLSAVVDSLGFTVRRRSAAHRPAASTLLTVGEATRARQRLRFGYRSWRGSPSTRDVDPYGLVFHAGHWYVTGFDHGSAERRTFRLDRISGPRLLPAVFTPPEGFDPVQHVLESLAQVPYAWAVTVLLETDLATARARLPASVARLEETADGVLMRTRAERLDGMAQMLAGLGWPFTVVEPAELRDAVTEQARRLAGYATRQPQGSWGES